MFSVSRFVKIVLLVLAVTFTSFLIVEIYTEKFKFKTNPVFVYEETSDKYKELFSKSLQGNHTEDEWKYLESYQEDYRAKRRYFLL